jgi:putative ABC transport system permease protein
MIKNRAKSILARLFPHGTKAQQKHALMYRSYLKIGWRNILKNKGHSYINIVGLSIGMTVTILIGVWVFDEVSFNKIHTNYSRIAEVYQHKIVNNEIETGTAPSPLALELRSSLKDNFKNIVRVWWPTSHTLSVDSIEDLKIPKVGTFIDKEGLEMFSFPMIKGSWQSLNDQASIVLSEPTAVALFGDQDPINQMLRIDNLIDVKVTGVYKELPKNSAFYGWQFVSSWDLWISTNGWMKENETNWNEEIRTFVELKPSNSFATVSEKVRNIKRSHLPSEQAKKENPILFLQPMSRWHLYSEWKEGKETGGRAQLVWLFGIIGGFVLALACINFMNLSTAQSQLRAKEVGIRKSIGSARSQLIAQFFTETFVIVLASYIIAVGLATLTMPWFNELADKDMSIPWSEPIFILASAGFVLLTSLMAGGYPALFLSSFQPIKVLKGTFKLGHLANAPRKVLVVVQFVVSVSLIVGTITVWRQIQFAKDRPVGYTREGLIMILKSSNDFWGKADALRNELKSANAIVELAESSSPVTENWFTNSNFNWRGKDPDSNIDFMCSAVSHDYGRTMDWHFKEGRDFSLDYPADSSAIILNEATARLMNWENPLEEELVFEGERYKVIGIIQDVIAESPYETVKPGVYFLQHNRTLNSLGSSWLSIRLNPKLSTQEAISRVEKVFQFMLPSVAFDFKFVDQEYADKFSSEQRVGKLAILFAILAIFISCLGLFGLTSFVAQQSTKEIGIRKVLGATTLSIWKMLSLNFVTLVLVSSLLAIPIAYYFLNNWLQGFEYRTEISWWIFACAIAGAILVTLLTVSYQAIKAALMNPVKSLRSE